MSSAPVSPLKIIIIDDDGFLLEMYALKFTQKNFDVLALPGTLEALEKLRGGYVPDVLVVDLVLPAMDGFEFLEVVKNESLAPGAVKVVLSNLGQEEDVDRATKLGADGYIIKASATPSEVVSKVEGMIANRDNKK
ncbi:MAG: DNA-binding response regulator, LuxR family [Candidatus Giovannonibacteria bacterium GW2011_GWA2_53_7]|uniref:DNA-binding response regulator, LuxR family n=1 Tax=Candidatus Giovannonibacteria bacterium GW2011_GWA2_53_7 TaxID=1618650 RepID=A0A0G1XV64_9BACT|nr:MAG: DNA-binding response regulator, LuxR family [Candidatus Giovannonibacteria bacterium GW2011_GWA2_53_7]